MRAWKTGLLAAAAAFTMGGAAWAQVPPTEGDPTSPEAPAPAEPDLGGVDVSFNVGVASDYVFRGVSQTDEGTQVFGGVDVTNGMYYAGVWASNVDFSPGDTSTDVEVDVYAGVKPEFAGWTLDFAAIYYAYLNQPDDATELGYFEAKAGASRAFGPATLGAAVYYSPEFFAETGRAWYYEANGSFAVNDMISVSGAVGRQVLDEQDDADYTTWNVGATFTLGGTLALDVRYHDTDADEDFGELYDERVVGSIKAVF